MIAATAMAIVVSVCRIGWIVGCCVTKNSWDCVNVGETVCVGFGICDWVGVSEDVSVGKYVCVDMYEVAEGEVSSELGIGVFNAPEFVSAGDVGCGVSAGEGEGVMGCVADVADGTGENDEVGWGIGKSVGSNVEATGLVLEDWSMLPKASVELSFTFTMVAWLPLQ